MKTNYLCFVLGVLLLMSCKDNSGKNTKVVIENNIVKKPSFSTSTFISLSDVHLHKSKDSTKFGHNFGDYAHTSGNMLWQNTMNKINSVIKHENPKFMVYLGDLPNYYSDITGNIGQVLKDFRNLTKDIPILYLPGNNDTMNGDYHSFQDGTSPNGTTIFSLNNSTTDPWPVINANSTTTIVSNLDFKKENKEFGYYSVDLTVNKEVLHVIALNTVIFCNNGSHTYSPDDGVNQFDATQKQFAWLESKLDSYATDDNILIMMHIPPGIDGFKSGSPMWRESLKVLPSKSTDSVKLMNAFLKEIDDHKAQIRGILTGHTHLDGLRRLYNSESTTGVEPIAVSVSTPGVAVNHGNNPGFKTFTFNTVDFSLTDFTTYYATPNKKTHSFESVNNTDFTYDIGNTYTFKTIYGITDPTETIYTSIKNMSQPNIIYNMKKILGVNSNQDINSNMNSLNEALDVLKQ